MRSVPWKGIEGLSCALRNIFWLHQMCLKLCYVNMDTRHLFSPIYHPFDELEF